MKLKCLFLTIVTVLFAGSIYAQSEAPANWFNLDYETDGVHGVSTEKAYNELLKGKKSTTIIVSIIDSGMDEEHEDLKEVMWVNADEIPGNGIDDDNNGYIDDINGWNFIGGAGGKNIHHDALEATRLYAMLKDKKRNKKEEKLFKKVEKEIEDNSSSAKQNMTTYDMLKNSFLLLEEALDGKPLTMINLEAIDVSEDNKELQNAVRIYKNMLFPQMSANGMTEEDTVDIASYVKRFDRALNYFKTQADYYYNADFDPRAEIVGDDYKNSYEKGYGNNDVEGPDAQHGTHVGGIVGAKRNNDIGMDGVADNVQLMSVRAVPDGDERDKDVANAIIYSVDNGAKVINMSFGKGFVYDKKAVDKAVKYAEKKGVLLVHAAGNSSLDTDVEDNYPNKYCNDKRKRKPYSNWIEVGALSWKGAEDMPATFTNYGAKNVDVFAPGVDIYSTIPGSEYEPLSGTSMASPVTAGVAALVWSYYPELTVQELRKILVETSVKVDQEVNVPGSRGAKKMAFSEMSNTGGIVNAYNALKAAEALVKNK